MLRCGLFWRAFFWDGRQNLWNYRKEIRNDNLNQESDIINPENKIGKI